MRTSIKILGWFMLLIGTTGFFSGLFISMNIIPFSKELPLSDIQGFVVDNQGNVYVALNFYGKIQKYDSLGQFERNWEVPAKLIKSIELSPQGLIVVKSENKNRFIFAQNGLLMESNKIEDHSKGLYQNKTEYSSNIGHYEVVGGLFPRIIKKQNPGVTIIRQSFLYHVFKGPFPAWFFAVMGILLLYLGQKLGTKQ